MQNPSRLRASRHVGSRAHVLEELFRPAKPVNSCGRSGVYETRHSLLPRRTMATSLERRIPFPATMTTTVHTPDEALVRAAQTGDRSAFGLLYSRYSRMVHGILLSRVPYSYVDDLLQDVFLQAMPRLASLRDVSKFPGWLAAIARNRATDFHRRGDEPHDELDEEFEAPASSPPSRPSSAHASAEAHAALDAILSLPETYRETLILRLVEGMTGPEIAARTGLTHGSVRVNLYRGMQQLREILGRKAAPLTGGEL
jgi:RNA polymerase sigma-70 factor, ECF subfamily